MAAVAVLEFGVPDRPRDHVRQHGWVASAELVSGVGSGARAGRHDGVGSRDSGQVGHLLVQGDVLARASAERQADVGEKPGRALGLERRQLLLQRASTVFCRIVRERWRRKRN